ncbi:TIGR02996 domain-containing protein [Myxococcus sp. MISCRS1]|uniref:TIGR02996 domain-containing protein n=1 Tax=Myxococcus sp. MISCRS1 TaxID=2996786 RepID=UPI0022707C8D|nr:TIGR02996 domain-containing protein [Myxococcus sp. MISCRS1]MCY0997346.1 TIGR02996 domain-containing protein [Myxococcus sp. MISCRS1]
MNEALHSYLERAVECFTRQEEEEAFGAVMDAWRECRASELVFFTRQFEARLDSTHAGREGQSAEARRAARDLARRLGAQGQPREVEAQLDALLDCLPDPRFIPGLLAIARLPSAEEPQRVSRLCAALRHVGPPFDVEPLEALSERMRPEAWASAARLSFVIRLGRDWVPQELDAKARELLAALWESMRARAEMESRGASIRAQWLPRVYANPEDDDVRLVMADQLLETGDPLGEFIVLQCSPTPDEKRIDALLAAHLRSWELPLGDAIDSGATRFERGFPVAVRMAEAATRILPQPGPAWLTVREIDWAAVARPAVQARWLAHPHLRSVTRLRRVDLGWARLLGPLPSISRLELWGRVTAQSLGSLSLGDVFDRLALWPNLSWLELRTEYEDDVHLCARSTLATKLERFDVTCPGVWSLTVRPGDEVSLEVTLVKARAAGLLWRLLSAAEGFGKRGLRVRCHREVDAASFHDQRWALSGFSHIEWVSVSALR